MSDDVKIETPTTTETSTPTPSDDTITRLKTELREAGETGKRQWQDAFGKTREAVAGTRAEWTKVATRTRDVVSDVYARAQVRGADLLLRLVSQVRANAEAFESSLRQRTQAVAPAESPQA